MKAILHKNQYPSNIINEITRKFIEQKEKGATVQATNVLEEQKICRYIVFPFVNKKAKDFTKR